MTSILDPARLAALAALAKRINGDRAPEPLPGPVLVDEEGRALVPVPDHPGVWHWTGVSSGVLMQWAPSSRAVDGALLLLWGGPPGEARDCLVAFLTPTGLRTFAADLIAIADRLEART